MIKASSEQKVCNSTTLPNPIESLKRTTHLTANRLPHFGGPHRYTLTPLKTKITLHLYWGMARAAGRSLNRPGERGVSAQTLTLLKLLHRQEIGITRVNHWSLFLFLGLGEEKKTFSFLGFRALTCWGGPQVLLSASHHHSQRLGGEKDLVMPNPLRNQSKGHAGKLYGC